MKLPKQWTQKKYEVILVARNELELIKRKELLSDNTFIHCSDLTIDGEPERLVSSLLSNKLCPDVIIHNLGGRVTDDYQPLKLEILRNSMRLNVEIAATIDNLLLKQTTNIKKIYIHWVYSWSHRKCIPPCLCHSKRGGFKRIRSKYGEIPCKKRKYFF